ncbi:hypothetical protein PRIPAC_89675 [Pristionchus pacificus]|uniref:Uncharacterized protein n=1 Tax=Pristionchus pacificus TaxID=54126 RepID=A0A2A6CYU7_PRIPA|nr:hypothetical protein PRIPAC_89675 [Pristionchus pacificus]|eukprot:PDM83193.1 hypothetical protein PRIPAC_37586 [Pristionchus pacificus]
MEFEFIPSKIKQSTDNLLPSRLFSDGLFTFDGKFVTVATSILALVIDLLCIVAVPDRWALFLFGIVVNLFTIAVVNRPTSCGFSFIYVINWVSFILALICSLIVLPVYVFVGDDTLLDALIKSLGRSNTDHETLETVRSSLPGIRLVMIGMVYVYIVLTYISVAAMRHIRRSAEKMLLPQ